MISQSDNWTKNIFHFITLRRHVRKQASKSEWMNEAVLSREKRVALVTATHIELIIVQVEVTSS